MALMKQNQANIDYYLHDTTQNNTQATQQPTPTNAPSTQPNTQPTHIPHPQTTPNQTPPATPLFSGPIQTIKLPSPNQRGGIFNPLLDPVDLSFVPSPIPDLNEPVKTITNNSHWREITRKPQKQEYTVEFPSDEDKEDKDNHTQTVESEEHTMALSMINNMSIRKRKNDDSTTTHDKGKQLERGKKARAAEPAEQQQIRTNMEIQKVFGEFNMGYYTKKAEEAGQNKPPKPK